MRTGEITQNVAEDLRQLVAMAPDTFDHERMDDVVDGVFYTVTVQE